MIVAAVLFAGMRFFRFEAGAGGEIEVTIDGELYGTYLLNEDQEIEIQTGGDRNVIRIQDGVAFMEEANCPDGYCMEQGKVSRQRQTIVCLPHKLVVEVTEGGAESGNSEEAPDTVAK